MVELVGPPTDTVVENVLVVVLVMEPPPPPPVGAPQGSVMFGQPAGGPRLISGQGGYVIVRLALPTPPGPGTGMTVEGMVTLGDGLKCQPLPMPPVTLTLDIGIWSVVTSEGVSVIVIVVSVG